MVVADRQYSRLLKISLALFLALVGGLLMTVTAIWASPLADAPWNPNVQVNDDVLGGADQSNPALAASKTTNDVYALWEDLRNGDMDIYAAHSTDGGVTWGAGVRVNHDSTEVWRSSPDIALNAAGVLHAVWGDSREGTSDVYYARSTDQGQTWSTEIRINDVATGSQSNPAIAVSGDQVCVAWQDDRTTAWNPDIYVDCSSDGGLAWGVDSRASDGVAGTYDHYVPDIAIGSSSRVHVVWYDNRNGNWDIYYAHSAAVAPWTANVKLNVDTTATSQFNPAIAADGLNVHAIWSDSRSGSAYVYGTLSTDGGDTWSRANAQVSALGGINDPAVTITGQGTAWATWRVFSGTYRLHADSYGLNGWNPTDQVVIDSADYKQYTAIAAGASRVYAAWQNYAPDNDTDILLSIWNGASWSAPVQVNDEGDARQVRPDIAIGSTGTLYAAWVDYRNDPNAAVLMADRSTNSGNTWGADVRVDDGHAPAGTPALDAVGASTVHVAWESTAYDSSVIYYDRSLNGAQTWGTDVLLSVGDYTGAGEPDMVISGTQNVYVVWRESGALELARSLNNGTTWFSPTTILTSTGSVEAPTIAKDSAGILHLAWAEILYTQPNQYHIGYARSLNGGQTWSNRQFVDMGTVGTERANPDIAVNPVNGYVHLVWDDNRTGTRTLYHAVSTNSGVSWSVPAAILAGPAVEPAMAIDAAGVIYVLWQDGLAGDTDVAYTTSINDGATWSMPGRVNDDATTWPQRQPAVVAGNSAYAVWNDFRRANWDIFASGVVLACPVPLQSGTISGPSGTTAGVPVELTANPVPPNASLPLTYVWSPTPAAGQGTNKATYYWQEPGTYPLQVAMSNCGGAYTATHRVSVVVPPPVLPCIVGTVYYATTPLAGIQVDLVPGPSSTGPASQSTTTGTDGRYSFCNVAPGDYWLKRYGPTAAYIEWTASSVTMGTSNLVRDLDLPKLMTLLTPTDGATTHTTVPTTTWQALPEADRYTFQINKTSDWTLIEHTNNIIGTAHQVLSPLDWNTDYTWQIDAYAGTHWVGTTDDDFTFDTGPLITIVIPPLVNINSSLRLEEAAEGVVVNKLIGDGTGKTAYNYVDVVAYVSTNVLGAASNARVILTVPGNVLGAPVNTWVRDSYGTAQTAVSSVSLGGGQYQVTTNLPQSCFWWFCTYRRQVVWRFRIPNTITPQTLNLQSRVTHPDYWVFSSFSDADLRLVSTASALIVTNRAQLYDNHTRWEVTSLLSRVYDVAQGSPHNDQPLAVVYNADLYDTDVRDWNNTTVSYVSETTANVVADELDDLIEDWVEDGAQTWSYHFPFSSTVSITLRPYYLLFVGDDDVVPFYRYNDPFNDEAGWSVSSATNPAIRATDFDYFFTDNPYGDLWGGTDWREGDLELAVGRLLGESADDMRYLLNNSLATDGGTWRAVMASVDGWELGLPESPACGSNEVHDTLNVPARLIARGFNVRNDTETPRTVDVMSPFDADWNTGFRTAANAGMDIFFIGGHNSYNNAGIPGDDFTPDDTCSGAACGYNRFDNDHPLTFIVGCHGGLPVPDVGGRGGVDDNMVYDVVQEGGRAYVGATGYSYGSPGSLCYATWGERLLQQFFAEFLKTGTESRTIGDALRRAKDDYTFGQYNPGTTASDGNALDRKTVTEFNLYGVPWQRLDYPGGMQQSAVSDQPSAMDGGPRSVVSIDAGAIVQADTYRYTRTITVDIGTYDVGQVITGGVTYEVLSIAGGGMAVAPNLPMLPYVQGYTLTLPISATVQSATLVDATCGNDAQHEVPIIVAQPWTEGGTVFTTTTDIDTFYPADDDLLVWQPQGNRMLFTLFPIQHTPTNNQTRFCQKMVIEVAYDAPVALAVSDVSPLVDVIVPGATISVTALLENVTDQLLTVTSTLTLLNAEGHDVGWQDGGPFSVPSDGTQAVETGWNGALPEGAYGLRLVFWDEGVLMGMGTTTVDIVGGALTSLAAPAHTLVLSETAAFTVTFANYLSEPVTATAHLMLYDDEGLPVATLDPQTTLVGAGDTHAFVFTWEVGPSAGGTYSARASVAREDGPVYGPLSEEFEIGSVLMDVFLPVVLRDN